MTPGRVGRNDATARRSDAVCVIGYNAAMGHRDYMLIAAASVCVIAAIFFAMRL